jgi:hypothetical protein
MREGDPVSQAGVVAWPYKETIDGLTRALRAAQLAGAAGNISVVARLEVLDMEDLMAIIEDAGIMIYRSGQPIPTEHRFCGVPVVFSEDVPRREVHVIGANGVRFRCRLGGSGN